LVAVDEMIGQILWTRLFMLEQGIKVSDNILYQGKVFQKFRDVLMGAVPKWYDID
jgi:hypothetical protein